MKTWEMSTKVALIAVVAWMALFSESKAQTLLRWKLKPGEVFTVRTHQETESQVAFGTKSATTKISDDLQLTWSVAAADDNAITIRQTIQRIAVNLAAQDGATTQYDSESSTRPMGHAQNLASSLKPLIGAEFEIKLSPLGKVLAVKPVNDAAQALLAADDKSAEAGGASRSTIQQLLRQPLVILDEKEVKAGDTWASSSDLATAAGPMKQETTYELDKIDEQDGKSICQIAATTKLTPQSAANTGKTGSTISIKDHDQTATISFSATDGRLIEVEQTQKLVTERQYRETKIVVTLNSTQTTKITPSP